MAGTFKRSYHLVKQSWGVLRQDKEIMWFPVLSGLASLLLTVVMGVTIFFNLDSLRGVEDESGILFYAGLFVFYLVLYFVASFFQAGLVTCVQMRLQGQNPTFRDGWQNAMNHLSVIFLWSLVSATVGIVLRIISDRSEWIGKLVAALIGMGWSILTFFAVPVLVLEKRDLRDSVSQSGALFRKTWGENAVGQISISVFMFVLAIAGIAPIILGFWLAMSGYFAVAMTMWVLTVLYWIGIGIISATLDGVFRTALYHYATTGQTPPGYDSESITGAFKPKSGSESAPPPPAPTPIHPA